MDWINNILNFLLNIGSVFTQLFYLLANIVIVAFNLIISLFASLINLLVSIFPNSPFLGFELYANSINEELQYLAWFIPIKSLLQILIAWVSCMLVYYVYGFIMRWIKLID